MKVSIDKEETKENFLNNLCHEIKYKKICPEIAKEFEMHIDELANDLIEVGTPENTAYKIAVERMGNPSEIGMELNKTYKPLMEWSVLFLTTVLVGMGLFILLTIKNMDSEKFFYNSSTLVFTTGIGIVAFIAVLMFDYKKLEKLSLPCYVLISTILLIWDVTDLERSSIMLFMNRSHIYIHDLPSLLTPFLIISFAGVVKRFCSGEILNFSLFSSGSKKKIFMGKFPDFVILVGLAGIPIFSFLIMPRLSFVIILGVIFLSMITYGILRKEFKGNRRKYIGILYSGGLFSLVVPIGYITLKNHYISDRLKSLFNPQYDPTGVGYPAVMASRLIQSAKLFGKTSVNTNKEYFSPLRSIINSHNDYIFTTIVVTFGWVFAIMVLVLLLLFVWRIMVLSQKISDDYGRILTIGICAAFTFQIVINILVSTAILPSFSINLPFISYGGTGFVCNMVLVGLLLSVYRRKNLISKKEQSLIS